jgi:hypothetical protein
LRRVTSGATVLLRLTVRLDKDVCTVAMALTRSEQISVAEAINHLVRQGLERRSSAALGKRRKNAAVGFPPSAGKRLITSRDVERVDTEDDEGDSRN